MLKNNNYTLQAIYGSLFYLILLATIIVYWQGLESLFLFDDDVNLKNLANITDGTSNIIAFTLEGISSQLGRPLSLLTFALQADDWPINPFGFKYVNLIIHLINGCLIFWLILLITRCISLPEKRSLLLALLTTTIWLLNPLQVSTVLYVIQRMTQLSVLFTLIGLLFYLYGRIKNSLLLITIGVVAGGILAVLSKENGILLVLYIIVLEVTILSTMPKPNYWRIWSSIFLYFPLLLLAGYFLIDIDGLLRPYEIRDFTIGERLLTQAGILIEYFAKISLLHPHGFGLFHDDFPISRTLWDISVFIKVSFIIGIFITAILVRRILPIFAFGVLWFFAGHILESSFVGLMLYFEHRNYLPMLSIIFTAVYGVLWLFDYMSNVLLRRLLIFCSILWLAMFPTITWNQTDLWGKPAIQTIFLAQEHPKSLAAQTHAIVFFLRSHEHEEAEKYTQIILKTFPKYTAPYLYLISLSCMSEKTKQPDMQKIIHHFQTSKYDQVTPELLAFILEERQMGHCNLDTETMDRMFKVLFNNENYIISQANLYKIYAMFHFFELRFELAITNLKKALEIKDKVQWRFDLINLLFITGKFEEAKLLINETRNNLNPLKKKLYTEKFQTLEAKFPPIMQELH
ncbi:hypothetical protein QUF74_05435 [Candidatus Halobeggiatoa sp. HSG11]|nr:hypothetical protein [Candidatus Halobeggiatoa sp. HSG11]